MGSLKQLESVDEVERLLFDAVRPLYARDSDVPGLLELPVAQLRALNVLGRQVRGRMPTMGEMADSLGVALSTATQLVERIEKRGLVRREHSDPDDRRVVSLALTDEGRQLLAERLRLRRERLATVLRQLTDAQQEALVAALKPLAVAARHLDEDAKGPSPARSRLMQEVQ